MTLFTVVFRCVFLALDEGGCSSNIVLNQFTKGLLSKSGYEQRHIIKAVADSLTEVGGIRTHFQKYEFY